MVGACLASPIDIAPTQSLAVVQATSSRISCRPETLGPDVPIVVGAALAPQSAVKRAQGHQEAEVGIGPQGVGPMGDPVFVGRRRRSPDGRGAGRTREQRDDGLPHGEWADVALCFSTGRPTEPDRRCSFSSSLLLLLLLLLLLASRRQTLGRSLCARTSRTARRSAPTAMAQERPEDRARPRSSTRLRATHRARSGLDIPPLAGALLSALPC
jgi:hypothetical protein